MTTREQEIGACYVASLPPLNWTKDAQALTAAAARLKRDGELIEKVANLCSTAISVGRPEVAAFAQRITALLKEAT